MQLLLLNPKKQHSRKKDTRIHFLSSRYCTPEEKKSEIRGNEKDMTG
jgi:hypothetical protein